MTEPSDAGSSGGSDFSLGWGTLMDLLDSMVSRTRYWWAVEMIDDLQLTDDEIEALRAMPAPYRQRATAQLLDCAESLREGSRSLDAQLMRLTGEMV